MFAIKKSRIEGYLHELYNLLQISDLGILELNDGIYFSDIKIV